MSNTLTTAANYLFGWTVLTITLSWLLAGLYPVVSRILAKGKPESAAFYTLLYGLLAPTSATTALSLLSLPALAFPFIADHCHGFTCSPHALHIATNTAAGIIIVTLAVTLLLCILAFMLIQLFSSSRRLQLLSRLSETSAHNYRIVDESAHIAWCTGLLRPQVFVSRGLIDSLTNRQLEMVLAHELTHAIRKDNLRKWLAHWGTFAWPPLLKAKIRRDLSHHQERICDLAAARINKNYASGNGFIWSLAAHDPSAREMTQPRKQEPLGQKLTSCARLLPLERGDLSISGLKSTGTIACAWLIASILALRLGHPLLEWLSQ